MKFSKIIFTFLFCLTLANQSQAGIAFDIKNEENPKAKILFFGFHPSDQSMRSDAYEIITRVKRNLDSTNLFEVIESSQSLEYSVTGPEAKPTLSYISEEGNEIKQSVAQEISVEMIPDFNKYNKAQISAIVVAQFNYDFQGNLEMRVRLWDVLDQRQLFGKFYSASKDNYKKMSNSFSDEIFKAITGEKKGHFNSQIVYVSEAGSVKKRIKKLVIMDFDGENRRLLSNGSDLVLTPVFAKSPNEIFYLRYFENRPQIFNLNYVALRNKKVGGFRGTTFAASPHPLSSNVILLSAIFDGNSDIYELYIEENRAKRLTKSPAIDTTAAYSPDGKSIIFTSDRDAGQQIYVMNENGSDVKRLSSGSGSYSKPTYSPDGKLIAFTRIKGGQFYIGTMSHDGRNERLLTSGYMVEGAKWSPNGRYIIYSKKKSAYGAQSIPRLYIIDIATGFEFELPLPAGEAATDPDWAAI